MTVKTVSCCGAVFTHYEERGRLEQLFELERTGTERLSANIARHARRELESRLTSTIEGLKGDGVIFLVDTGFAYPYFQVGPVLDACTNLITPPMALVVFYPGEVDVIRLVQASGQCVHSGLALPFTGGMC